MIKLNNTHVPQNKFPDGTLLIKYMETYFANNNIIEWKYENDGELFTLICLVNHIREHKPDAFFTLIMPYLPHARMDRVKEDSDIFTLKYFCQVINSLNFETVLVKDAHSNVGLALLDRVKEIKPWGDINEAIEIIKGSLLEGRRLIAFFPDEGAMKRYTSEADVDMPFTFGVKRRDWKTGKIEGLDIAGNVSLIEGSDILIIDDICSRGGTFMWSADKLKEAGAENIYLYVTHCENTIHEGELLKNNDLIKHIFTTDSLITKEHKKITIL